MLVIIPKVWIVYCANLADFHVSLEVVTVCNTFHWLLPLSNNPLTFTTQKARSDTRFSKQMIFLWIKTFCKMHLDNMLHELSI